MHLELGEIVDGPFEVNEHERRCFDGTFQSLDVSFKIMHFASRSHVCYYFWRFERNRLIDLCATGDNWARLILRNAQTCSQKTHTHTTKPGNAGCKLPCLVTPAKQTYQESPPPLGESTTSLRLPCGTQNPEARAAGFGVRASGGPAHFWDIREELLISSASLACGSKIG